MSYTPRMVAFDLTGVARAAMPKLVHQGVSIIFARVFARVTRVLLRYTGALGATRRLGTLEEDRMDALHMHKQWQVLRPGASCKCFHL